MAERSKKSTAKSPAKKPKTKKTSAQPVTTEEIMSLLTEGITVEEPVAEEKVTEVLETQKEEPVVEETPVVEEKPVEKPKRKYTRRTKTEETPVVEEKPVEKPKRKYTRRAKTEETPVVEEKPAENTSAPKFAAYIQGAGAERSFEELSEKAVKLSGIKSPKSVNLYIKPYESDGVAKVYYVVDKKAGHFNLFD